MPILMEIKGLMVDPSSNMPIVILRDPVSEALLPIWVGVFEANAISLKLEDIHTPRPMTHDLMRDLIDHLGAKMEKLVVHSLRENTFLAAIHLTVDDRTVVVDSRPSDAIALAIRTGAQIFVDESVLEAAKASEGEAEAGDDEKRLHRRLEDLSLEELGKYKM